MASTWDPAEPGVLALPSGRLLRGRALGRPLPEGLPPQLGVYLLAQPPEPVTWESRWVRWPDFGLPADHDSAEDALREARRRSDRDRVEVACHGGRGRTGTALACLAVLDGIPAAHAVAFVREHYDRRAVETRAQRHYVLRCGRR